jgi:pimeloyl-ACP methyl ester carboxylesterase
MSKTKTMTVAKSLIIAVTAVFFAQPGFSQSISLSPLYAFDTTMYGRNKKAGKFVKIRGFNMYYETYGKGEPLLIIHGNGGSIKDFVYQIPFFSKRYKVIVADSRAHGKSLDRGDSLSYEMMADDFNALLDTLQIDSCYVIGWSDGGINGLLLAIRYPDKVKKLAVTGASLSPDTSAVTEFIYKNTIEWRDSLAKLPNSTKLKTARILADLLANEPHITTEQLNAIQCPTLVIGGDHDLILPKHTLLIAQSIKKSYLWIVPHSGHSVPVFYKDEFNRTVNDFFKTPYRSIEGAGQFY